MPSSPETTSESAPEASPNSQDSATLKETVERDESRNILTLALYQIIVRVGWIFKTETVIMPAFLDLIGGGPVLRGMLPVLNKFGMSVPPVLISGAIKKTPLKKWVLLASTFAMSIPFLALALLWQSGLVWNAEGKPQYWLPWVFLALYGLFFCITGVAQLASHTLQGKLIRPNRRGRLMAIAMAFGTPAALFAAWCLLGKWLNDPTNGYGYIFAFCGCAFALASGVALWLREPAVKFSEQVKRPQDYFVDAFRVLQDDSDFRRLAVVTTLFSFVIMLFPHYQAMGRIRFNFDSSNLLPWILVQNVGIGVFSSIAGPAADRWGNRLILRIALFAGVAPPVLATTLTWIDPEVGKNWFWLVFLAMGTMPVMHKITSNYALEISTPADHPKYISTLGLCLALPIIIGSPLVGLLIGVVGFKPVCLSGAALIALGGLYTFHLREPRHTVTPDEGEGESPFELDE